MSTFVSVGETTAGLALHAETWRPAGEASAVLVFIHGLGDHVGRYAEGARARSSAAPGPAHLG